MNTGQMDEWFIERNKNNYLHELLFYNTCRICFALCEFLFQTEEVDQNEVAQPQLHE